MASPQETFTEATFSPHRAVLIREVPRRAHPNRI
jgi:hypothetical protein